MAAEEPQPSADDKARYAAAKKDLIAAIANKRNLDKQLVRLRSSHRIFLTSFAGTAGGKHIQLRRLLFTGYIWT
jgi:hypothetical protein